MTKTQMEKIRSAAKYRTAEIETPDSKRGLRYGVMRWPVMRWKTGNRILSEGPRFFALGRSLATNMAYGLAVF